MDRWIGFIGINAMRQGVARNLIKVGFEVCGCDVRAVSVAAFVGHGGKGCDAPARRNRSTISMAVCFTFLASSIQAVTVN